MMSLGLAFLPSFAPLPKVRSASPSVRPRPRTDSAITLANRSRICIRCNSEGTSLSGQESGDAHLSDKRDSLVLRVASRFTNLFPIWTILASAAALRMPSAFLALTSPKVIQAMLSLLMLSTGLTLSPNDLLVATRKPRTILFAFAACYVAMPLLALVLCQVLNLNAHMRTGLVMLAIVSGGQASNLCTHIAGGDTALSVTMTTVTTLAASLMLPLLSYLLLGTVVSVNRVRLALTTAQVTLLPIGLGASLNHLFPRQIAKIQLFLPILGIISVIILVLGPVAQSAAMFGTSWKVLIVPVLLLHLLGGLVGFSVPTIYGASWATCITIAFETGFKSPALSFVLAKQFFPPGVELASAVSIVVLAPLAALCAVIIRTSDRKSTSKSN